MAVRIIIALLILFQSSLQGQTSIHTTFSIDDDIVQTKELAFYLTTDTDTIQSIELTDFAKTSIPAIIRAQIKKYQRLSLLSVAI